MEEAFTRREKFQQKIILMNRFLSREVSLQVLQHILKADYPWTYDPEKHRVIITGENYRERLILRLPLVIPFPEKITEKVNYIVLLIQSGSCAIGYFENGVNVHHKVFRSYMVRMKQGTSQVKYLKTKGKSRAGSRVRLAETEAFFENINERLQEYFAAYPIHRVALSCSKILIPYLFNAKATTPFHKRDERIYKIPKHIHLPIYEVLLDTNKFLQKGELIYEEAEQELVSELLASSQTAL